MVCLDALARKASTVRMVDLEHAVLPVLQVIAAVRVKRDTKETKVQLAVKVRKAAQQTTVSQAATEHQVKKAGGA